MKPTKTIIATLVICMTLSGIALAEKPYPMNHDTAPGLHGGMAYGGKGLVMGIGGITLEKIFALELSDEQKKEVADILAKYRDGHRSLTRQLFRATKGFRDTLANSPDNETAVRQAYKNMSMIMEDLIVERAKIISELKPVLKKEQFEELAGPGPGMPGTGKGIKKHLKIRQDMMDTWLNTYAGKTD